MINKLDRERADFKRALESVNQFFGRTAVPIQLPIGAERDFKGVVDLVRMKAYTYTPDGDGKGKEGEIPADTGGRGAERPTKRWWRWWPRATMRFMEEFFDKGTLPVEHIVEGLRSAVREMRIFPVLCASGLHNIGTDLHPEFHQ